MIQGNYLTQMVRVKGILFTLIYLIYTQTFWTIFLVKWYVILHCNLISKVDTRLISKGMSYNYLESSYCEKADVLKTSIFEV